MDISKCDGTGCRIKSSCYRYQAPASEWQSYIKPEPRNCTMYWPRCKKCGGTSFNEKMGGLVCDKCRRSHAYSKGE